MVKGKTCLYKYKMNKVKHCPILSHTCIHVSVQTTPVQFNWSISKNSTNLQLVNLFFFLLVSVPCIYLPYIYIYVTYRGPNSTYM